MDFTLEKYKELLKNLLERGYKFQTFQEFLLSPKIRSIILRHDVDALPENSLEFAKIQFDLGIKGTYYFRTVPESWDVSIINEIIELGHEVGYHYETMDFAYLQLKKEKRIIDNEMVIKLAYEMFENDLKKMRKLFDVKTICMHGSPRSKYDNKEIWKKYDYKNLGILGEPYFDIDFKDVFYLTDTGRRWDGYKVSVRDKVEHSFPLSFHATNDIIQSSDHILPKRVMMTFHPQRWHDNNLLWLKEYCYQNFKNEIKRYFFAK